MTDQTQPPADGPSPEFSQADADTFFAYMSGEVSLDDAARALAHLHHDGALHFGIDGEHDDDASPEVRTMLERVRALVQRLDGAIDAGRAPA
ncbi:MAG: hypothetical protein IT355_06700 [Gemmatimonadaceae bacterium]|nr:hypothetical protein [Gemmatimonadaceae bacterium]